jgi:hypothetical protein
MNLVDEVKELISLIEKYEDALIEEEKEKIMDEIIFQKNTIKNFVI